MKKNIRPPFFVVNPKNYLYGDNAFNLALKADELAKKYDIDILFSVTYSDAYRISKATNHLIITAQHMDYLYPGRGMGAILPESLAENGIQATFLNHAEHPCHVSELVQTMKRANELDILTIVCADSLEEAKAIAVLNPDIMVCEPTDLIGTGQSSDLSYMKETNKIIKNMNPKVKVLQAAGISTPEDVKKAYESGADGTGGTSGIVCHPTPELILEEMLVEANKFKSEMN